jgi:hypothetical protein
MNKAILRCLQEELLIIPKDVSSGSIWHLLPQTKSDRLSPIALTDIISDDSLVANGMSH